MELTWVNIATDIKNAIAAPILSLLRLILIFIAPRTVPTANSPRLIHESTVEFSSSGVAFTKVVFEAEMNSGKLVIFHIWIVCLIYSHSAFSFYSYCSFMN